MMGDNTFILQSYDKSMSPPNHEERKLSGPTRPSTYAANAHNR